MTPEPNPAPPPAPLAPPVTPAGDGTGSAAESSRTLRARARRGVQPGLVAAWLLAAVGLTVSVLLWQKVTAMQELLARQSQDAGSQSVEARTLARQAEEAARTMSGKVATLETKVADMAAYRGQLDALVQSVARARDENLAVELEAAVRVAQDQAQLTGSVEPLLAALRTAERRLTRSSDPRLAPVLRAVARDLERVKSASVPDTAGLLARLDQLLRQVDDLPVANDVGRRQIGGAQRDDAPAPAPAHGWLARQWQVVVEELGDLLRVSRIERPDASMLEPEQVFFLRENLKLRLQGARLGLLARQYESARSDLAAASASINAWFDPASRRTQAAATLLQQIQASTKSADLPRVNDTLVALGNAVATVNATAGASGADAPADTEPARSK